MSAPPAEQKQEAKDQSLECVKVALRVRPMNQKEITEGQHPVVKCNWQDQSVVVTEGPHGARGFGFDAVFDESKTQLDVFSHSIRPVVDALLQGYNGVLCLFVSLAAI